MFPPSRSAQRGRFNTTAPMTTAHPDLTITAIRAASLPFLDAALYFTSAHDLLVLNPNPDLASELRRSDLDEAYLLELP